MAFEEMMRVVIWAQLLSRYSKNIQIIFMWPSDYMKMHIQENITYGKLGCLQLLSKDNCSQCYEIKLVAVYPADVYEKRENKVSNGKLQLKVPK